MNSPADANSTPAAVPARRPGFLRRLRERVAAASRSPHAFWIMLGVAVIDGSVFPVPPFAMLLPMVLAEPKRWLRYSLGGTGASLVGGLIGYGIGHLMQQGIMSGFEVDTAVPIRVAFLGIDTTLRAALTGEFWLLALLCSILPTPFKVVTIGSGLVGVPLEVFLAAAVLGRTARFFGFNGVVALFGERGVAVLRKLRLVH